MKIDYISDVHLEDRKDGNYIFKYPDDVGKRILLIAGDVGPVTHPQTIKFIEEVCSKYSFVIFVFGEHEYYGSSLKVKLPIELPNLIATGDPTILTISGITFLIGTFWHNAEFVDPNVSDYYQISDLTLNKIHKLHNEFKELLKSNPSIVVSHHAPVYIEPEFVYKSRDHYFTDIVDQFPESLKVWVHGHAHYLKFNKKIQLDTGKHVDIVRNPLHGTFKITPKTLIVKSK
jgi:predicted phosphodiesterase